MLMKKEVIEDNENLKKEIKDLKNQLEEEKKAYIEIYNRNQKAIEYIKHSQKYGKEKVVYVNGNDILEILKGE